MRVCLLKIDDGVRDPIRGHNGDRTYGEVLERLTCAYLNGGKITVLKRRNFLRIGEERFTLRGECYVALASIDELAAEFVLHCHDVLGEG